MFAQLYLAELGVKPNNEYYADKSCWFRDALVRASYSSIRDSIQEDRSFVHAFFENVALGKGNRLDEMDLNVHGIRVDDSTQYREVGDAADG